ncbi:TIGR02117 family protein [Hymenobacter taeanensis]|uniref:TIGR02117 family protein n=1 Tax=Hymenobacter taeanensis TaxID=2735321 RepID=A0A6M6BJH7_9BACT|nr:MULTISPECIES: TIGR02117 family protein [Hymenobacter]QJX48236.1 TIGR02117 family protein [Hymenobacter taeanensis]UOQ82283.1 TIGR02117 family protein [Hymenobacter sp. 5414T-23]
MEKGLHKALKATGYVAATLGGALGLYLVSAAVLSRITVPKKSTDPLTDVDIYIYSNGVHTDIVVPARSKYIDWTETILLKNTQSNDPSMQYIGFGWGDKGFYLDTPTWAELKPSTAFKAMFYLGTSAMHTTFYQEMHESEDCVKISISHHDYRKLIRYIQDSFKYDAQGQPMYIEGHSYGRDDSFYEAHRTYGWFYTCNTWANDALKYCGQKASLWTPFDNGIFYQYRN